MDVVVSVIIPCHNDHHRLPYALASFLRQAAAPYTEIIVVDDRSEPSVKLICEQYGVRYERIEAGNSNIARNRGITLARGSILVFFDADNVAFPTFLSRLCTPILNGQADVCYGRSELIGNTSVTAYTCFNRLPLRHEDLKMGSMLDTACAVRRSSLAQTPWDPTIDRFQDWDFHLSLMEHRARYYFVDELVYQYWLPPADAPKQFQSFHIRNSNRNLVHYKHGLDTAGRALVTLALPTAGRYYSVPQWLECIRRLDFPPSQLNLQFLDHSNDQHFFETILLPFVTKYQSEYAGVNIAQQQVPKMLGNANHVVEENERGRTAIHANNMHTLAHHATTPYIFFLEDDTLCPPDTLRRLLPQLMDDESVGAIQGIERSRVVKYSVGAWRLDEQTQLPQNLFFERQSSGTTPIGAGGFYCLLTRSALVKKCPFPTIHVPVGGPDIAFGWWLAQQEKSWLNDWSVQCSHIALGEDGRVFELNNNRFNEPSSLFLYDWLTDEQYPHRLPTVTQPFTHVQTNPNLKPTLVLHSVSTANEVKQYLTIAKIDPSDLSGLHLIAQDAAAHAALTQTSFPPGTVLVGLRRNRADYLNELLRQPTAMIVLANATTIPCNWLLDTCRLTLASGATACSGAIHSTDGQVWQGGSYRPSMPLLQLDLCAINPQRIEAPLFEPRLAADDVSLGWAVALELYRRQAIVVQPGWPIATTRHTLRHLQQPDWFTFGIAFGLCVPLHRVGSFVIYTLRSQLHASPLAILRFTVGLLADTASRVMPHQKRHFRTPKLAK